jgi:hypothetical protein
MRKKVIVRKVRNRETGNKTLQAMNRKKMIENFEKNFKNKERKKNKSKDMFM